MQGLSIDRVRELKGAPLSVFLLLVMATTPVSQEWLASLSGYTDKPIRQAITFLQEIGWVVKTSVGWHLSGGVQLILGQNSQEVEDPKAERGQISRNNSDSVRNNSGFDRNNSDQGPIIIINQDSIESEENNNNTTQHRKNSDVSENDPIWNELRRVGVYRNDRTQKMVRLPHMSVEYVRRLSEQLASEGKGGILWAGLFVQLCERAEPIRGAESVEDKVNAFMNRRR